MGQYAFRVPIAGLTRVLDRVIQAGQNVDWSKRYGMFAPVHPLFKQRQIIAQQQAQIKYLQQSAVKRFLKERFRDLRDVKIRPILRHLRKQFISR